MLTFKHHANSSCIRKISVSAVLFAESFVFAQSKPNHVAFYVRRLRQVVSALSCLRSWLVSRGVIAAIVATIISIIVVGDAARADVLGTRFSVLIYNSSPGSQDNGAPLVTNQLVDGIEQLVFRT